jgi:hypothetical protein
MHRTKPCLFDHLVGAAEQRGWHGEAKRLGRFEIDNEFDFRRLLHREVGGPLAVEYPHADTPYGRELCACCISCHNAFLTAL